MKHLCHRHVRRRKSPSGGFPARAGLAVLAVAGVFGQASARGQTTSQSPQGVRTAYAETAEASRTGSVHRDPQVVPAGAHVLRHHGKHRCSQGGCGPDGRCVGTCVVRPERFGYYATQWRAWPGDQGVRQTSLQEMTPVSPPASAIPSVDQEALLPGSLDADAEEERSGAGDAFGFGESMPPPRGSGQPPAPGGGQPARVPQQPPVPEQPRAPSLFDETTPATESTGPDGRTVPSGVQPSAPEATTPTPDTPPEAPADTPADKTDDQLDNLFDEFGSRLRLRERLAVAHHRLASARAAEKPQGRSQEASSVHDERSNPPQRLPESAEAPRSLDGEFPRQAVVVPAGETQAGDVWRRPRAAVVSEEATDRDAATVQSAGGTSSAPRRNPLR